MTKKSQYNYMQALYKHVLQIDYHNYECMHTTYFNLLRLYLIRFMLDILFKHVS